MNKSRYMLILPMLLALAAGCASIADAGAVAGASALAYWEGTVTTIEGRDLDQMWHGSQAALQKMGYSITSTEKESFGGRIIARALRDRRILVELKSITANTTNITVKVGDNFGDENSAKIVLQSILTHFTTLLAPAAMPPATPVRETAPPAAPKPATTPFVVPKILPIEPEGTAPAITSDPDAP